MNSDPTPNPPNATMPDEHGLDAAQQSLSDALGVSFAVLKILMGALVVVYLFSGVFLVDEQKEAVRLRFGKTVKNSAGEPIQYKPGWHIGLPFPLEDNIQIPINEQRITVDQGFWYDIPEGQIDNPAALARQPLDPLKDGFLVTGDANIIHLKFVVGYTVSDINAYIQNVGKPDRAEQIVRMAAERSMVIAMASADAKDIIESNYSDEVAQAARLTREILDDLETGLELQQILIDTASPPVQIQASAYQLVSAAEQDRGTQIQSARQEAAETLNGVAGAAHDELTALIRAYEAAGNTNTPALADALRAELDQSLRDLQLFGPSVNEPVQAYLDAMTRTADDLPDTTTDPDAALMTERDRTGAALLAALEAAAQSPRGQRIGQPIGGQVAAEINHARAYQSQVLAELENEYSTFSSRLEQYRVTPLLVAHAYLQDSRERILADGLIETFYLDTRAMRIVTGSDPEVAQEIIESMLNQRRQEAQAAEAAARGTTPLPLPNRSRRR